MFCKLLRKTEEKGLRCNQHWNFPFASQMKESWPNFAAQKREEMLINDVDLKKHVTWAVVNRTKGCFAFLISLRLECVQNCVVQRRLGTRMLSVYLMLSLTLIWFLKNDSNQVWKDFLNSLYRNNPFQELASRKKRFALTLRGSRTKAGRKVLGKTLTLKACSKPSLETRLGNVC